MPYLFRGRYLFVELLGRGGMGAVFRAYDQAGKDHQWVAVKVVSQTSPERAALRKEMFQKEAAAAQMLAQHKEFFVSVLGHDGVDPAYLVLEHIPWQTLEALRFSHPRGARGLPPAQVARIGIALLRGVARMHFHRIVHQDLTPANLFVNHKEGGEGYEVKITDLGIWTYDQVQWDSEALTLVAKPGISGTPHYMSPEQSMGSGVSALSDLHTIGSVLWELATGEVPYPADLDRPPHEFLELRVKALQTPRPRPKGMPPMLYKIISRALEFEAQARWSSAPEMAKALDAFVEHCRGERQRDLGRSSGNLEKVSQQVIRLEDKLASMRALTDRLSALGAMVRQVSAEREDVEPEELHTFADEAEKELDEITGELRTLGGWLDSVGRSKKASMRPLKMDAPVPNEVTETLQVVSHARTATPVTVDPSDGPNGVANLRSPRKHMPAWLEHPPLVAVVVAVAAILFSVGYLALRPPPQSPAATPSAMPSLVAPEPPPAKETTALPELPEPPAPAAAPEVEAAGEPPATGAPSTTSGTSSRKAVTGGSKSTAKPPSTASSSKGPRSLIQDNPYK
jgi:serine/threonine-protein kinase